jgi:hypothetical protein
MREFWAFIFGTMVGGTAVAVWMNMDKGEESEMQEEHHRKRKGEQQEES